MREWQAFKEPFSTVPEVLISLSYIDAYPGTNLRVCVHVDEREKTGFYYTFETWYDTKLQTAKANWIAVGN